LKIKICGLFRSEDIEYANKLRPDYIGFVFYEHSKRFVSPAKAAELKAALVPQIKAVGVFVNAEIEYVLSCVSCGIIDIIQLHGSESEAYITELKAQTTVPIIKAGSYADLANASTGADFLLFDSPSPGSGKAFDWSSISGAAKPYFLAGGINTQNIEQAIALAPYGIDVSSGAEREGVKDFELMSKIINKVRGED
jgi:phosphoribosylanthranilate isomerase